jgi:hypothetical protein
MNDMVILQVKRLYDNYSQRYDEELLRDKVNFILKELPWLEGNSFKSAVDFILQDENIKKFPTIAQIRAYLPKKSRLELKDCDHCRGGITSLWIFKPEFNREYSYAYACPFCEAGKAKSKDIPILPYEYHSIPYEKLRERRQEVSQ